MAITSMPDLMAQCNFKVDAGPDILVCRKGDMDFFKGKITGNPFEYYWEPPTNLSNPKILNPKVTVFGPETYILVARGTDNTELINNGDFSAGNVGFYTDYVVGTMSCYGAGYLDCEGTYDVITNPQFGHTGFAPCGDHTSGSGNMMVLNGAANLQNVWCQTINVMPDMDYTLSAWITAVVSAAPPILQFSMNGDPIGNVFNASGAVCNWQNFTTTFNVGANTSIEICIVNLNTATGGNDFAVDDISLKKICEVRDTVEVDVIDIVASIDIPEIVNCDRPVITLDGSASSSGPGWTYQWTSNPGKIVSGGKTNQAKIEGPGMYTLTVCAPLPNCCESVTVEVLGNITPPKVTASTTDTLGCGKDFATIKAKSNNFEVRYFWSGPTGFSSEDQNPVVTEAGTYIITVVDEYNCKGIDSVKVLERSENPKVTIDYQNINCKSDTSILKANSSIKNSNFKWLGPNGKTNAGDEWIVADSGTYYLITTTPSGCIRTDSFQIKLDKTPPQYSYSVDTMNCLKDTATLFLNQKNNTDLIRLTGPGAIIKLDSQHYKITQAGTYQIELEGSNGCITKQNIEIFQDIKKPIISSHDDTINCLKNQITLSSYTSDTSANIVWKNPSGNLFQTKQLLTSDGGTYTLVARSSNGCSDSIQVKVLVDTVKAQLNISSDTLTCTKTNVILNPLGDTTRLNFKWSGPGNFNSILKNPQINVPGLYTLQVEKPNHCISDVSVNIIQDIQKPILSSQNDVLSCAVDSIQLKATISNHNGTLYWKGPNGNVLPVLNPFIKTAGDYILYARNTNGCSDSFMITISQDIRKPDLTLNNDTLNCFKKQITLTPQSSFDSLSYSWVGPNGFTSSQDRITINTGGTYTIRIQTPQKCFSEQTVNIAQDTLTPKINLTPDTLDCLKTNIILSYKTNDAILNQLWSGPNNFTSTNKDAFISQGGFYDLIVTGINFCTQASRIFIVQDTIKPTLMANTDTITCNKKTITLQAKSNTGINFLWILPNGTNNNQAQLATSLPGTYRLTTTGLNHCKEQISVNVGMDTLAPRLEVFNDTINCNFPVADLKIKTSSNNLSYLWNGPNQFKSNKAVETTTIPGLYELSIQALNGCITKGFITVAIDTIRPRFIATADSIDCKHSLATIQVIGIKPNQIISWNNLGGQMVSNQSLWTTSNSGIYSILVTDTLNGCRTSSLVEVKKDSLLIVDINLNTQSPKCGNEFGTTKIINIIGGHGSFNYSLDNGKTFTKKTSFDQLLPGNYSLLVRDTIGCEFSKSFDVIQLPFVITDLSPELTLELGETQQVQVNTNLAPNMIRTITWSPTLGLSCTDCTNPIISTFEDTEYSVTVIDTNGCESTSRIRVKVKSPEAWLPNVFSPNGDLINDYFYVHTSSKDNILIKKFQIYDRWGDQVFESTNSSPNIPNQGWNGYSRQKGCNPGVFVYKVELELLNGKKYILKGDVTLCK